MTEWNEDNFLERLLAEVRQQRSAERDPCPDTETLCAVLEGEAPIRLRELVLEHLRHCPDCAELQNRLLNFEAEASPEPEVVWKETRKRLDNWLEGFLASAVSSAPKPTAASRTRLGWEAFWSFFYSRKFAWGVGAVALLVLIGDAILVLDLRREHRAEVQVAAKPAAPQTQQPNAQPPEKLVSKSRSQKRIEKPLTAPRENALPQLAERLPSNPQPPNAQAAGAAPGQVAEPLPPSSQGGNPQRLTAQAVPVPGQPATMMPAAPMGPSIPRPAGPKGRLAQGPFAAATIRSSSSPAPKSGAGTEPQPSLRLEPSAHLLVALSSAQRLPNGSFEFHGTLLLPVARTGAVTLDRGAEVVGAGETREGKTSLAVMEFVVQGVRYILKDGSGAMKAQTPGTGGAVQFERSQVLEMWPMSALVYEKAPGAAAQPEPQK